MKPVRVRFAPSPTGPLHIGGARTALYNFLFAKKHGGKMILRIEDTDRSRYMQGAEKHIKESLLWLGIHLDEGPGIGGNFAPYRQSEQKNTYRHYAQKLVDAGYAYLAFDSESELIRMRERLKARAGFDPQYDATVRMEMNNSLTLSDAEVKAKLERKEPFVIRLKMPADRQVTVHDCIRGKVVVNAMRLDDKILIKSDGMPTYHLAHVVDDYCMHISHVIRGEEWLPSTPAHVLLYEYLGWEDRMPVFAHLPLLLKPDGKGKLSKRDAEQKGFTLLPIAWTDPATNKMATGFREQGYLPEALINFLVLLGWNPGTSQELFTLEQLVDEFVLEKIHRSGARCVFQKAKWFNQQHLRLKPNAQQVSYLQHSLKERQITCSAKKALQVTEALKDRVAFPSDFFVMGLFFFQPPTTFDPTIVSRVWTERMDTAICHFRETVKEQTSFSKNNLMETVEKIAAVNTLPKAGIMQAVRLALTGGAFGPDLATIITILGSTETVIRLDKARAILKKNM